MKWKQTINQKGNYWWQVGKNRQNYRWLPKRWINVREETPYGKKEFGHSWVVHAPTRINKETISGNFLFFKSKRKAMNFAKIYRTKKL